MTNRADDRKAHQLFCFSLYLNKIMCYFYENATINIDFFVEMCNNIS